jgi:hypothetical protein
MVKVVDGGSGMPKLGAFRSSLLLALLGLTWIANACGGRTVWVEEETAGRAGDAGTAGSTSDDDDGGFGGVAGVAGYGGTYGGYGGDYGGSYGGSYGGYGGDYGGSYGGYGGDYGGGAYGGVTGGAYPKGGYGGTITGGYGGTFAGSAGVAGKGGCGAVSGSGGGGSPALGKACSVFCPRFPYLSCPSDFESPRDCLEKCQNGFGLGSWCDYALYDFLVCASGYLNPQAMCVVQGDVCYGPGCTVDAVNGCLEQYLALGDCQDSPRPLPPCPPPPNPPLPPNCGQVGSTSPDYCLRETTCPNLRLTTQCFPQFDVNASYYCDCFSNGEFLGSVQTSGTMDPCQAGAALCGFY